jgi:hypothetical protein
MNLATGLQEQSRWPKKLRYFLAEKSPLHRTHIRISDPASCPVVAPIEMTDKNKVPAYQCCGSMTFWGGSGSGSGSESADPCL